MSDLCPHTLRYIAERFDQECTQATEVLERVEADYVANAKGCLRDLNLSRIRLVWKHRLDYLKSHRSWLRGMATRAEKKASQK